MMDPKIPVVGDDVPHLTTRDVYVSGVGAVRPLETVASLRGALPIDARQWCSDSEESDDDVLPVGALIPVNRPACCAQLDDFGWEVPDCVPDMLLSGRDRDVELTDLTQDVLPDMFPVVSAGVLLCHRPYRQLMYLYHRLFLGGRPLR